MYLIDEVLAYLSDEPEASPSEIAAYFDDVLLVQDKYIESRRWYELWTGVLKYEDQFVAVDYAVPATELQEDLDIESEAYEVEPYEVLTIEYRRR